MRLLLDTHIFLWFISGDARLSPSLADTISDPGNDVFVSVASVWEAIIKSRLGRLSLPEAPEVYLPRQRERHLLQSLPIDEASVTLLAGLPELHRDPFDRILICQALCHNLVLVTVDRAVRSYSMVTTLSG
jgi:PIN domain nuclease of toxin-antitoxin system